MEKVLSVSFPKDVVNVICGMVQKFYFDEWKQKICKVNLDYKYHIGFESQHFVDDDGDIIIALIWWNYLTRFQKFLFFVFFNKIFKENFNHNYSARRFNYRYEGMMHWNCGVFINHCPTQTKTSAILSHNFWHCCLPIVYK